MWRLGNGGPYLTNWGETHNLPVMTLAGFSRISVDPLFCGGGPVVTGTRVRVTDVLEI